MQKWEWTFLKVLLALCIIALGLAIYGAMESRRVMSPHALPPYTLRQVSHSTDLVFPPSARLKRSLLMVDGLMGFGWAEIQIALQEVEGFKKATAGAPRKRAYSGSKVEFTKGYRMTRMTNADLERRGVKPPAWWHPERVREGVGTGWYEGTVDTYDVLIRRRDDKPATVCMQRRHG